MILTYKIFTTILYPFLFILLYLRKFQKKEDPKRFKEKILVSNFNVKNKDNSELIWFHAASIGEFLSIIPIIEHLNLNKNNLKFLITTTTLSSGNLSKKVLKNFKNVDHRYFPFDIPFLIENFLYLWKPDKIFLVDSEIWPNLLFKAKKFKIPIALINARLTTKSFNKWMMFPFVAKKIFGIFNLSLCSNIETKNYLKKLNVKNVHFKGNIKLIGQVGKNKIDNKNKKILSKKRFWMASSTHEGEDFFCLKTHLEIKKKYDDIITVIAPRHINRVKKIESLAKKLKLKSQILSKKDKIFYDSEIVIINFFGALKDYYAYAKSVFIGKSMIKKLENVGGQNPIEAAKLSCKIYHGPYVYNFKEIYKILNKNKISKKIDNHQELSKNLIIDLKKIKKQKSEISSKIKKIEHKTLINNMILIKKFIYNDVK
jgi:3-deoxy-D-manno-octulosonic-acid transferase